MSSKKPYAVPCGMPSLAPQCSSIIIHQTMAICQDIPNLCLAIQRIMRHNHRKKKKKKCFKVGVLVSWSHYNKHHRLSHSLGGWKPEIRTPAGWGSGESSLPSRQVTALTALSHGEEEEKGAPGGLLLLLFSPSLMSNSLAPIDSNIPRLPFPLPSLGDVQF